MTRALLALALLAGGCVPSFDQFNVIDPGDDGGPARDAGDPSVDAGPARDGGPGSDGGGGGDAGRRDAGPGGSGGAVLDAVASCDEAVGSVLLLEEFDAIPSTFQNITGSFEVSGGDLVILGGDTATSIIQSTSAFSDVVSCADVALPAMRGGEALHELGHNLRGLQHGVTCYVDAVRNRIAMFSLNPGGNALIAMEQPTWLGDAVELRMLIYQSGTVARCEVRNLDTDELSVLDGTYGGVQDPVRVTFEGMARDDIRIRRVVAGPPSAAARGALP